MYNICIVFLLFTVLPVGTFARFSISTLARMIKKVSFWQNFETIVAISVGEYQTREKYIFCDIEGGFTATYKHLAFSVESII